MQSSFFGQLVYVTFFIGVFTAVTSWRDVWTSRYHETTVHQSAKGGGGTRASYYQQSSSDSEDDGGSTIAVSEQIKGDYDDDDEDEDHSVNIPDDAIETPVNQFFNYNNISYSYDADDGREPLSDLIVDERTIKEGSDVNFLLDFGIIGHSLTAGTALMKWITRHPKFLMHSRENHWLNFDRPGKFVEKMYKLPRGQEYLRGYKSHSSVTNSKARGYLREHFPKTNLIIGLRNPVTWFNATYNSRLGSPMPPAEAYVGNLPGKIMYPLHMSRLGLTEMKAPDEKEIIRYSYKKNEWPPTFGPIQNKVFLYDVKQVFDKETHDQFRKDLSNFIGLDKDEPLLPIFDVLPETRNYTNKHPGDFNICLDKYKELRDELITTGQTSAYWILKFFLASEQVVVSNRKQFIELLKAWQVDPCDSQT